MTSLHIKSSSSFTFFSGILHHYYSSTTTFSIVLPLRISKRWGDYCCDDTRCENICCGCRWGTRGASGVVVVCSKMIIGLYFRTYSKLEAELSNTCKNIRKRVTNIDFANIKRCACIEWKIPDTFTWICIHSSFILIHKRFSRVNIHTRTHEKKRKCIRFFTSHHDRHHQHVISTSSTQVREVTFSTTVFYTSKYSSQSTYASFS